MTYGKGFVVVAIIITAGILTIAGPDYLLGSKPESGSNKIIEKFSDEENQADKAALISPSPYINSSSLKSEADVPGKPESADSNTGSKESSVKEKEMGKSENSLNAKPRNGIENNDQSSKGEKNGGNAPAPAPSETPQNNGDTQSNSAEQAPVAIPKAVEDKASTIAQGEVQSGDFVKVASVLLGKLSITEIKYLFDSASNDYWVVTPVEEIEKARSILFSKLSENDLNQLYQLGKKYGRSMAIIDPGIDVADTKAKQIKYYEEMKKQAQQ